MLMSAVSTFVLLALQQAGGRRLAAGIVGATARCCGSWRSADKAALCDLFVTEVVL
jgi:hypothetical protein